MTAFLLISSIFLAGLGTGYYIRARISSSRRKKYLQFASRSRVLE